MSETKSGKAHIEIAIDRTLLAEAVSNNLDMAEVLEAALARELEERTGLEASDRRANQWRSENADAIKSWNDEIDRIGLWSDGLRTF